MSNIYREILKISLPAIITNITTPLLGLVDIAIVGHMGNAVFIGAIAVGSSVFNMVYWLLNFLRMGTSGLTAQAFGADDISERDKILWRGVALGSVFGLLLLVLSPLLAWLIIPFMEADASTSSLAEEYFTIAIWGAPAYLASYAFSGWLLGCQNSVATLKIAIVTNVSNIILSLLLVVVFNFKIEGVALGTAISQWIGAAFALILIVKKYRPAIPPAAELLKGLKRFFSINFNIFLRTACLVAVTVWFTRSGARFGSDILAANALLMQFFMLFSFFMDGMAFSGEALGGKYFGSKDYSALFSLTSILFKWGIALSCVAIAIYFFFGEWILSLLTDEDEVIETAKDYITWAITIPLFGFMAFIYDGIFIGLTLTRDMLISMAIAVAVYFLLYFSLSPVLGNHALWIAFSVYLLIRGVVQSYLFLRFRRKLTHL